MAVDRFFHALYSAKKNDLIPLLLGTACSEVTETLAKIVRYWNVIQVSFGSTAPALSDSTEFPLFLRTVAPDSSHNPARIALIKHFGWDTVTALSQTDDMYSLVSEYMHSVYVLPPLSPTLRFEVIRIKLNLAFFNRYTEKSI